MYFRIALPKRNIHSLAPKLKPQRRQVKTKRAQRKQKATKRFLDRNNRPKRKSDRNRQDLPLCPGLDNVPSNRVWFSARPNAQFYCDRNWAENPKVTYFRGPRDCKLPETTESAVIFQYAEIPLHIAMDFIGRLDSLRRNTWGDGENNSLVQPAQEGQGQRLPDRCGWSGDYRRDRYFPITRYLSCGNVRRITF